MVADCSATCAKYLLCIFNFVFFVIGSAVLCIGIWLAVDKNSFIKGINTVTSTVDGQELDKYVKEITEPTVIEQGAYILIAAGGFIFIISFLGYCGAIKESRVLLTAYGIFLVIIALLQVAAIVLAAVYKSKAEDNTRQFFLHTLQKYYTHKDKKDAVTLSWDFMMAELQCCGVNGMNDFESLQTVIGQTVPETCCILKDYKEGDELFVPADDTCTSVPHTNNSYMDQGCYEKVVDWINSNLNLVIGTAVAVIGVQVLGIIFAFCLCNAVNHERRYPSYKYN